VKLVTGEMYILKGKVASIAAALIVMSISRAVFMKSMQLKHGNWEPFHHYFKTEETTVDLADHRNFRNHTDFDPVVR
jgi:hypothetical protein